jgi:hypothetical protein
MNIAEILKDCPIGMELDCTMYEDVYLDYIDELNIIHCYIQRETYKTSITFNQYGTPNSDIKSKCVIFPKGKTTWEGFTPPCKFKDGDKVLWNYDTKIIHTISKVQLTKSRGYVYWIDCEGCSSGWWNENELTPIPNKFDITTLKPFDKVLVRQDVYEKWGIHFFGFYNYDEGYYYTTGNWIYRQCIPYEQNKHLLGTTNDCDEFYKTWAK